MSSPDGGIQGPIVTVDGQPYFVIGKNRIKITEHFSPDGKPIDELIADYIIQKVKENTRKPA